MFKKGLVLLLLVVMASSLFVVGCESSEPVATQEEGTYKIVCNLMDMSNPYFVEVGRGYTERCLELGIEPNLTDGKMDAASQVAAIENYVASGVDAILIAPANQSALSAAVKNTVDQGVVVVSEAQAVEGSSAAYIVDEYNYGSYVGTAAGNWINEHLGGEAEVAILNMPEVEDLVKRAQGIEDSILKIAPNAKIVARQAALSPEAGMTATENIMQAHPNVKVIAAVNDAGALGALEVVKSMRLNTPDFFIGGLDATQEAVDKMQQEGSVYRYTADLFPYQSGRDLVDIAIDCIKNGPKDEPMYLPMGDYILE